MRSSSRLHAATREPGVLSNVSDPGPGLTLLHPTHDGLRVWGAARVGPGAASHPADPLEAAVELGGDIGQSLTRKAPVDHLLPGHRRRERSKPCRLPHNDAR